jgi:hypothetical protein
MKAMTKVGYFQRFADSGSIALAKNPGDLAGIVKRVRRPLLFALILICFASCSEPSLYVSNDPSSTLNLGNVTGFTSQASGNAVPCRVIAGPRSGINRPVGIAIDARGTCYVLNVPADVPAEGGSSFSINIYKSNANGDAVPMRTFRGDTTTHFSPSAIALDPGGSIWLANSGEIGPQAAENLGSITEYVSDAGGHLAPARTVHVALTGLKSIAFGSGGNLYVLGTSTLGPSVAIYASLGVDEPLPIRLIAGDQTGLGNPLGLAVDGSGNIYVSNLVRRIGNRLRFSSVTVYAPEANGNVEPVRTIYGAGTEIIEPYGIAVDGVGTLYLINRNHRLTPPGMVLVFPPGADGNVAPARIVAGNKTGLYNPTCVAANNKRGP